MDCKHCGTENPEFRDFCKSCGALLPRNAGPEKSIETGPRAKQGRFGRKRHRKEHISS